MVETLFWDGGGQGRGRVRGWTLEISFDQGRVRVIV